MVLILKLDVMGYVKAMIGFGSWVFLLLSAVNWRYFYRAWDGKERKGMDEGGEEKTKKGSDGLMAWWVKKKVNLDFQRERERECVLL